jgi:hypothetical protein
VPSDGNARSGVNEFESIFMNRLLTRKIWDLLRWLISEERLRVSLPRFGLTADVLVIRFEEYAAAYEGTEVQYFGKGDIVYLLRENTVTVFSGKTSVAVVIPYRASLLAVNASGTVCKEKLVNVGGKTLRKGKELRRRNRWAARGQRRLFAPERNRKDVGVGGRWWFAG